MPALAEHLSFSRIRRYTTCPYSYALHYLRKEPAEPSPSLRLGSALHAALERVYQQIVAERITGRFPEARLVEAYQDAWAESGLLDFASFQDGLRLLVDYVRRHPMVDHATVLGVEQEFRLDVGGFEVLGYIDRVDKIDDETIFVVDYKSNRIVFTRDEVDQDLQLSIYAMAARMLWPWAKTVRLGFYLLRHGVLMETIRTEEDLAATRAYVTALGRQLETAAEFPARLNEHCVSCDHRAQCPTYHRALLGRVELVCEDEADLVAVAQEREEVAHKAKVLYARKEALDQILRARLEEAERLELGGMVYTVARTTHVRYPTAPTLALFRGLTGQDDDALGPLLLSVDNDKVDALVTKLSKTMSRPAARLLRAWLHAVADKTVSPRLQVQRAVTRIAAPKEAEPCR